MKGRIMLQGTGSHVGKTVLCTALCYIFSQQGYRVAPFKAWNLTNRSYTLPGGEKIGLSLALQARAAGIQPRAEMNPILVSPQKTGESTTHLYGESSRGYRTREEQKTGEKLESPERIIEYCYNQLAAEYDLIVIEGAGSPIEPNSKGWDLLNMHVAKVTESPVLLVTDIDLGQAFTSLIKKTQLPEHHVTFKASPGFASLVGTLELLSEAERQHIRGLVFNRFRGTEDSLQPVLAFMENKTGIPVLGVIPHIDLELPEEDISERDEEPDIKGAAPEIEKLGKLVAKHLNIERLQKLAFE